MADLKMPERLPSDGAAGVSKDGDDYIIVNVDGHHIRMSRFNAWRVFGMLALVLGIPLPSRIGKAIKF